MEYNNFTDPFMQESGFFEVDQMPLAGLLPMQTATPKGPQPSALERATGLLNPAATTDSSLSHFSSALYDLRPQSHLVKFMRALLGDSGAGQLHKRNLVTRLGSVLSGSRFYELDGLYGSIFSDRRHIDEKLPMDPRDSVATPEEWDAIAASDAKFRERIIALAKAIPMGATVPGMQQAAEAVVGAPCQIYEIGALLNAYGTSITSARNWVDVAPELAITNVAISGSNVATITTSAAHGLSTDDIVTIKCSNSIFNKTLVVITVPSGSTTTFTYPLTHVAVSSVAATGSVWNKGTGSTWATWESILWSGVQEATSLGRSGVNTPAEFVVRPIKHYKDGKAGIQDKKDDQLSLIRVLSKLKPAGSLLTIDGDGVAVRKETRIANLEADSNFWAVTARTSNPAVYPSSGASKTTTPPMINKMAQIPVPPMSTSLGHRSTVVGEIVTVNGYSISSNGTLSSYSIASQGTFTKEESMLQAGYKDKLDYLYTPAQGVMDPYVALGAILSHDINLVAHPYQGKSVMAWTV